MRLLICDAQRLFFDALTPVLTARGHTVVATALNPDDAVRAAREHRPDVCLLELNSSYSNDLRAIGRIHRVSPETKVVVLSDSIDRDLAIAAVAKGAQGLVSKNTSIADLDRALVLAQQGYMAVEPLLLQKLFGPDGRSDAVSRSLQRLTAREREVLGCIADGLSTKQMAEQLGVRVGTARTHVHNVLTKLGVHSRRQAATLMATQLSKTAPDLGVAVAPVDDKHTAADPTKPADRTTHAHAVDYRPEAPQRSA